MTRIFLSKPHMAGEELAFIGDAFDSGFVAPAGPQLDLFERITAEYLGNDVHCVALSSGTSALHLALIVAGVERGDTVWVSSMTFAGGIFPVNYLGATPVFFDLDANSWTLSVGLVREQLNIARKHNRLPKAIIPTDLYGQPADIAKLEKLANEFGVKLIVDSAESLGGEFDKGRKAGAGGHASILSFNGNKIITTSGGGMLVTRNKDWAETARFLSTQARDNAPHYQHSRVGYNYRLSNISAAIGCAQMKVLDERVSARRKINAKYREALNVPGINFMPEPTDIKSTKWLTAITIDPNTLGVSCEDVRVALAEFGIETRPLWKPMHLQPVFEGSEYVGFGVDEQLFKTGLCLPSASNMSIIEQSEVIERLITILRLS